MTKDKKKFAEILKKAFKLAPNKPISQILNSLEANLYDNDEKTVRQAKTAYKKFFKEQFKGYNQKVPVAETGE